MAVWKVDEKQETAAADRRVDYPPGTILRVRWPLVDGSSKWCSAMVSSVSDRTPPRRQRSTVSHYRYTLSWRDDSPSLVSRLLHLPHRVVYKSTNRDRGQRRFLRCTKTGARHELPRGICFELFRKKVQRLKVAKVAPSGQTSKQSVTVGLNAHPDVETALRVAMRRRMDFVLHDYYMEKKARRKRIDECMAQDLRENEAKNAENLNQQQDTGAAPSGPLAIAAPAVCASRILLIAGALVYDRAEPAAQEEFADTFDDMVEECGKHGKIKLAHSRIIRPRDTDNLVAAGIYNLQVGDVLLEFESKADASQVVQKMRNQKYDGRRLKYFAFRRKLFRRLQYWSVRDQLNGARSRVGLRNLGNTCFLNSVLQCLLSVPPLVDYFQAEFTEAKLNETIAPLRGQLAKQFVAFLKEANRAAATSTDAVSPAALRSLIIQYAPRFAGFQQQDAHELLRFLLDGLHEDLNRVQQRPQCCEIADQPGESLNAAALRWQQHFRRQIDSPISDIFGGQLLSEVCCSGCGHKSRSFEVFLDLSLSIPVQTKVDGATAPLQLTDCFRHYIEKENLDADFQCDACKSREGRTKSLSICKPPKVLVVHLKRFSNRGSTRKKINSLVQYPTTNLDLSEFMTTSSWDPVYDLAAVSQHRGSVDDGHYTAACRVDSKKWSDVNDTSVSKASARHIADSGAYVLFYVRRKALSTL